VKPSDEPTGMPDRVSGCEQARVWLHEACDERRDLLAEQHIASCASCQREAALLLDLERLLASEPPVEVPASLAPAVMALVRADIARARRNARLALAGACAALVALAFFVAFFDVVGGATALAKDGASWLELAREWAPSAPDASSLHVEIPGMRYGGVALAVAAVIVAIEVRLLARRRVTA